MSSPNHAAHFLRVNLYASAWASGAGAALTGALLPALASAQHLGDQQSGLLIGSQFLGNFIGAITVSAKLHHSLLIGQLTSAAGLLLGVAAVSQMTASGFLYACFFLFGFGLGQMITVANLIVGAEPTAKRAAHLSFLNLLWGLGAMSAPLSIALMARASVPAIFTAFSVLPLSLSAFLPRSSPVSNFSQAPPGLGKNSADRGVFVCFALIFFLYGGTESSLSNWLSTYAHRYMHSNASAMPLVTAAFWAGLNVGRAAGTAVLLRIPERRAIRIAICGFILFAMGLTHSHSNAPMTVFAAACGLCLAPIFPAALSLAVELRLPARYIGFILALCGLGASILPALVGVTSYHLASLRKALWLPMLYATLMLLVLPVRDRVPVRMFKLNS